MLVSASPGKKNTKAEKDAETPVILLFGLLESDISSNYYMNEDLAIRINTSGNKLEDILTQVITDNLAASSKCNFNIVVNTTEWENQEDMKKLIDEANATYALKLNSYEVNWKGDPYYTIFHIVKFDLIDSDARKLTEGKSSFDFPDLIPVEDLDREYQKLADHIAIQTSRALK